MAEDLASSANQHSLPPEFVPEPNPLNRGEALSFVLPVDEQGHPLPYNALIDGDDTKAQLGVELPIVMHINAAGKELVVVDLRSKDRTHADGGRHIDTYGVDANGRTTDSKRTTRWDADFLLVGTEWNGGGVYRRGDRGYIGIRPPAAGSGEAAKDVMFGAGDGKSRDRFNLPAGMPQDAFHISYDGTSLKVTATEPITVTRMVEKAADAGQTEAAELQADESPANAAAGIAQHGFPGPASDGAMREAAVDAEPRMLDGAGDDGVAMRLDESQQVPASEAPAEPPVAPEMHRPSAAEIFESAESFAQTLADQELDPNLRGQLLALQETWRGVQAAAEGDQFWNEAVRGNLFELTETLSSMRYRGGELGNDLEEAQNGLSHLQAAIYEGRHDDAASVLQRYQFTDSLESMRYRIRQLHQMEFDALDKKLHWHTLETDDRYLRMRHGGGEMSEGSSERMIAEFRDRLGQGDDLQRLAADYANEHGDEMARWQRRRDALETLAELSRRTDNQVLEVQISRAQNAWEEVSGRLRGALTNGSRTDDSEVGYVRSLLIEPLNEVQFFRRLAQLTELAAEEVV